MRRVCALITRETGVSLPTAAVGELKSIIDQATGVGDEDLTVEPREVTILLADLRGFMALTATLPAWKVIAMLNRCLEQMSEVIFRYEGTIDKFMGDAIMVLFGAPHEREGDVSRALACAVEMQLAMRNLNAEYRSDNLPELHLGIGINTGTVMAGRFGSQSYSEYTVIGEEVNLASRIEAFSLRGQVLISESTYERCAKQISVTEPMEVHVKGKSDPVRLRELIGIPLQNLYVPRQESRRSHRVEVHLPCILHQIQSKIVMMRAGKGFIRDIGYHGVLLELDEPLQERSEVKMEFDLTLVDYRVTDIYAKVVNLKRVSDRWFAGVEFTSIDIRANEKIQIFVQLLVAAQ